MNHELLAFPNIVDHKTGEVLQINQLTPKKIESFLKTQHDDGVSNLLSKVNFIRKIADKIETTTKKFILKEKNIEFDSSGEAFFGSHRIKQQSQRRFSEKLLLETGTKPEIKAWYKLKDKYSVDIDIKKFG